MAEQETNNEENVNKDQNQEPKAAEETTMESLLQRSNEELARISSVFPFTLFPTQIIVDELKVTFVFKMPFTEHTFPVNIKDIKSVTVTHGIIFASLKLEISGYEENPGVVSFLKKSDAVRTHKIIVGLTLVDKMKADKSLLLLPHEEKIKMLETIGTAGHVA